MIKEMIIFYKGWIRLLIVDDVNALMFNVELKTVNFEKKIFVKSFPPVVFFFLRSTLLCCTYRMLLVVW